jgi:Domain of unknown function (DUF4328)
MSDTTRAARPFAPVGPIARVVKAVVIAGIAVSLVVIVVQLTLRADARDLLDGLITADDFDDRLGLFTIMSLLSTLLFVAQVAATCVFGWRLARNMQGGLARAPQTVSQPGVTVAANILGFCTLYVLNVFMWREIWRGSDPDVAPGDEAWKRAPIDPIVYVWFALSFLGAVLGFGSGIGQSATGGGVNEGSRQLAEDITDGLALTLITSLLGIAAAIAFIVLVTRLTARHMQATGETVR